MFYFEGAQQQLQLQLNSNAHIMVMKLTTRIIVLPIMSHLLLKGLFMASVQWFQRDCMLAPWSISIFYSISVIFAQYFHIYNYFV